MNYVFENKRIYMTGTSNLSKIADIVEIDENIATIVTMYNGIVYVDIYYVFDEDEVSLSHLEELKRYVIDIINT